MVEPLDKTDPAVIYRSRRDQWMRRLTTYFSLDLWARLDAYALEHRLELSDIIEEAVSDLLTRRAPRPSAKSAQRKSPQSKPPQSKSPQSKKARGVPQSAPPQSKKARGVPQSAPRSGPKTSRSRRG